jgi:hypothetical protein
MKIVLILPGLEASYVSDEIIIKNSRKKAGYD